MNDLISIPTVEQINLEHQLANSKASEAVQHATNCGLMLLQVKASLNHGEWLPWLKQQQESGTIEFSDSTAKRYMRVASNRSHVTDLEAPSIRAALELLSDREPEPQQQGTLIDVEAERQAREAAEAKAEAERQARLVAEQRSDEWRQSNKFHKKQAEAFELELIQERQRSAEAIDRIVEKEVIPADYEHLKKTERELRNDLADLKQQQREMIQQQVVAKLKEREAELSEMDRKVKQSEALLAGLQTQIDRYSMQQRELKVHLDTIEKARSSMALLAANLEGFGEVIDPEHELRQWRALADMLRHGAAAIEHFIGEKKPALTVIHGT